VLRTFLAAGVAVLVFVPAARTDPTQQFTIESVPVDGSAAIQLAASPWPLQSPVFSPDGRTVAFVYDLNSVRLVGADGTGERAVAGFAEASDSVVVFAPLWSRDAHTLLVPALSYNHYDPRSQSGKLYRVDASTGSVAELHAGRYASFSPDGRYLVYQTPSLPPGGAGSVVIGVCRSDGAQDTPFGHGSYAAWAPTSDRLAYVTRAGYLTTSTATGRARWTLRTMTAGPISWSPDGKTIFFSHAGSHPGLFSVSPGARRARRVVDLPTPPGDSPVSVSVSSNGRWIATSNDSLTLLVRSNGTQLRALQGGSAAWSPSGSTLALVYGNTLAIWTPTRGIQVDYTGRQRLADPSWSPDGARLLVVDSG
jgi:Tol biopolymer transport system component